MNGIGDYISFGLTVTFLSLRSLQLYYVICNAFIETFTAARLYLPHSVYKL